MAKKYITVGLHPEYYGAPVWGNEPDDSNDPTCGMLWMELREIMVQAHLTPQQYKCVEWRFKNFSMREIAHAIGLTVSTVHQHLDAAFQKMDLVPNKGLITVIWESQRWEGLNWVMNNKRWINYKGNIYSDSIKK